MILRALTVLMTLFINYAAATTLDDIKPHSPTQSPWNEQWFYYINDPAVGYIKVSLQTYIMEDAPSLQEKGYIHVVFTPRTGATRVYDYFFDDVQLSGGDPNDPYAFSYSIPGVVEANQNRIELTLPDLYFASERLGTHDHYWGWPNPGATPFGLIGELPFIQNRWFVFSLGTLTRYAYSDQSVSHEGQALAYIDKLWTINQGKGFAYIMATSDKARLMFSGGEDGGVPIELWAGKYKSPTENVTFYPSIEGLSVRKTLDACSGEITVEFSKLTHKLVLHAKADLKDFYDSEMPSVIVFKADKPVMKTMNAKLTINLYHFNKLVEQTHLPQGILEFGGDWYCRRK
ncbi:hypothetical protein O5O45_04285 [Hahella aquimaris]|uniref:hypothetical protein n=1 Tax=Hahella sp. HNIBRBA332 TaxID=3015983 RepID=UPI00273C0AAA|nr:hypothetical protein [Hahella sp. HNIBRBA332]WLQ15148.1 hypothetical protein O5O45_04285 [Hahella sp. HNIBRBA332]